jgi:hypothetical protein
VPSKPGYEPLSQAKPGRRPEVADYQPEPTARRQHAASGHRRQKLRRARPDRDLEALGVSTVAIPRKAKVSPARRDAEHARRVVSTLPVPIGAGAYGPSTEIRTRTNIPL